VVNSLTKLDCPVLSVLIPLQVLLNFRIAYSPPHQVTSRDFHLELCWTRKPSGCSDGVGVDSGGAVGLFLASVPTGSIRRLGFVRA
jgi:hypothetical protein